MNTQFLAYFENGRVERRDQRIRVGESSAGAGAALSGLSLVGIGWGPHLREGEMALTVALRLRQVEDLVHVGLSQRPTEGGEEETGH